MSLRSTLAAVEGSMARIGQIILLIVGNLGNLAILLVYCQKSMRRNPCSMLIIAVTIVCLFNTDHLIVSSTLNLGFSIDPSIYSIEYCRFKFYSAKVCVDLSAGLLALASVDRAFISSREARVRAWSSQRMAIIFIVVSVIAIHILSVHSIILARILVSGVRSVCSLIRGTYYTIYTYYSICSTLIPPMVMAIAGAKTIANVRGNQAGQLNTTVMMQKRDRQLILIIVMQVIFFIVLRVPQIAMNVYLQATTTIVKSADQMAIESFLSYLFQFCIFIQQTCLVFIHLMSTTFRAELKKVLIGKRQQHGERDTATMKLPMGGARNTNTVQPQ